MFSKHILKQNIKSNYKMFLIITFVLSLFLVVIIAMSERFQGAAQRDLTQILSFSFYGGMGIILPLIYSITAGNKLIASQVDRGSMAYLLSTPTDRNQISITSAIFYVTSIFSMFAIVTVAGVAASAIFRPGSLDYGAFIMLNLGAFLFQFAISGICYLSSCFFNTSGKSLAIGAGIPVAFYVIGTLSQIDTSLDFLKYFSLNTLYDTKAIISGSGYVIQLIVLAVIGIVLFTYSIFVFKRKDLPL